MAPASRSKNSRDTEKASETTVFQASFTSNILDRVNTGPAAALEQQMADSSLESITEKRT